MQLWILFWSKLDTFLVRKEHYYFPRRLFYIDEYNCFMKVSSFTSSYLKSLNKFFSTNFFHALEFKSWQRQRNFRWEIFSAFSPSASRNQCYFNFIFFQFRILIEF